MDDALHRARYEARQAYRGPFGPKSDAFDSAVCSASTVAEVEAIVNRHRDPFGLNKALNEFDRETDQITPPDEWEDWTVSQPGSGRLHP